MVRGLLDMADPLLNIPANAAQGRIAVYPFLDAGGCTCGEIQQVRMQLVGVVRLAILIVNRLPILVCN
ncbi:hypothetical protein D3C84_912990 [compost metagenome]